MKTAFSRKVDNVLKIQGKRTWGSIKETNSPDMPKWLLSRLQAYQTAVKA